MREVLGKDHGRQCHWTCSGAARGAVFRGILSCLVFVALPALENGLISLTFFGCWCQGNAWVMSCYCQSRHTGLLDMSFEIHYKY